MRSFISGILISCHFYQTNKQRSREVNWIFHKNKATMGDEKSFLCLGAKQSCDARSLPRKCARWAFKISCFSPEKPTQPCVSASITSFQASILSSRYNLPTCQHIREHEKCPTVSIFFHFDASSSRVSLSRGGVERGWRWWWEQTSKSWKIPRVISSASKMPHKSRRTRFSAAPRFVYSASASLSPTDSMTNDFIKKIVSSRST